MELLYGSDKDRLTMAPPAAASCMNEHGCVMFDCLVHLWEWIDPPPAQAQYQMEDKKIVPATQQPSTQQHIMAHHVHPDQIYAQQNTQIAAHITNQPGQLQMNGGMHQLMQNQYHSNMNARSPLLENRHDLYGTGHNPDYNRHYGANDNHNYPQSPPRFERQEFQPDQNVNHELLHNIPKGYNAEVYQDYLKRNPPKDSNQIYQNHQLIYRPNVNQYGSKPYLPYSNRIGPQSNTELLRRQYNEIQQMKMQQQMHYQNQAQMHQQQKFAERQLLLQQIHGVQPPPNLQNSIYSDSSYRDLDRYSSKNDFKEYSSSDINKELERYARDNEFIEMEKQQRQYQEAQWQANQIQKEELSQMQEERRQRMQQEEISKSQSPPSDYNSQMKKSNNEPTSPMKSSESSTPSIKSPSSESRRSSSGNQALRSPIAQRIPSAPVTMAGILYKQGSDGLKVWRKRWFVLSEYCLFYYKSQEEEKLLGSVLLPSYRVSACTPEDKVMRKFSFKLEHANMRTYVLAALDQESMLKWVKMLTMAALMQNPNDQRQNQSDRAAAKPEEEETPGPTYANAPPKPRRSNDGYSSPSPEMYDPNYDLLKQPASHYSQGQPSHTRYQDTQQLQQESTYIRSPQTTQPQQHMKRPYDMNLPLTNVAKEKLENNQTQYKSNTHSPYIDDRSKATEQLQQERNEAMYEKQKQYNPFLQDYPQTPVLTHQQRHMRDNVSQGKNSAPDVEKSQVPYNENYNAKPYTDPNTYAREVYGELNRANKQGTSQPTQDAYGRTVPVQPYTTKLGDYEDIYAEYGGDNQYGKTYVKSPMTPQTRDNISVSSHKSPQEQQTNYPQEKVFSGPSVLRRKKMQASGIQPPMPRPHSADFLEYEMKNENVKQATTTKIVSDYPKQPQRPKSSLDINSFYDPSSDRYYSEESYAEKMRKTAQLLQQQGLPTGNIQIPLAKYASGLVEKQLHSPYSQGINNNYETGFGTSRSNKDNVSYTSKYSDLEGIHSNWTLKEKDLENQKMRSGSVISDHSNMSGARDANRFDQNPEGFIRSASARVPSSNEREGDKKIHQKEESMKRLLEWKQRMLQSPLTRKSTPATISLARSLNQSRQSVRSDQYKPKAYGNASYNSYSSDDEASMTMSGANVEPGPNIINSNQQPLSKKPFVGSNTSIGRSNRDGNIPVRAVSPRVRWVEEKPQEHYSSQQMTASQQDLTLSCANDSAWAMSRSPSRSLQQPIRAVSPRVRISTDNEELDCLSSLKAAEREESLQKLEHLKMQLMELENQYEKSKPLVQLVDNMVKLGSLYNRPGSTIERLERNQRLRQKVLAEHALEQQRWLESAAAGKPLETEAARVRVAELWALEQELADEAAMIQGIKTDRNAIDSLLTGVRTKLDSVSITDKADTSSGLEAELARVHAMLAHNSKVYKKLEQTVADNARLERELQQLRRALRARRARPTPQHTQQHPTAMLEDEVTRVQQLVSALQRQRQELSRAVRHLTQQSHALQTTHDSMPGKRRSFSSWSETNLDTGHTIDHGQLDYDYAPSQTYEHTSVSTPLYVDTRAPPIDVTSPLSSEDMHHTVFGNLSNVEKQEIKTVRIVKRESERRQRDRERSLQPMSDWSSNLTANLDQFLEEELVQPVNNYRASSVPRTDYGKFEEYYSKGVDAYGRDKGMEQSPKYPSSPSLSSYDYSKDISSLSSSYNKNYDRSPYDRMSMSTQYLKSPTDSSRTLTNDPLSKTSSIVSLTRSNMELSPIFKSEAAKQIITEVSGDVPKNGSLHRRQVPKEKRRHYTAPHHLSAKMLNELPKDAYGQDVSGARSLDDADMERVVRGAAPDVVRSACGARLPAPDSIDRLLAAPQKILIPERYIPEKPPELSPEEQQKRQEKVESIKKMLTSTSADPNNTKSPDSEEKKQREHLLQMNQILAKQVTEMSKIIAVKALEELPLRDNDCDYEDRSPEVELPIYQQRENFFT
ncbi:uncharacterized protein LOC121736018 isoform X6 [Aricia agestis]|uniref:uncharacterized protein LOC121736018 isoform X6 n=1 Tax=Aricia agestis TaxID=91739 RepID=UPI001C209034|nr:uncharacterized protein LOC121736018 isoform X6 [Aricia agestis]